LSLCNISKISFAVGFRNGNIIIYKKKLNNGKYYEKTFKGDMRGIYSLLYLSKQDVLLSGEYGQVNVWSISQEKLINTLTDDWGYVCSLLCINEEILLSGSYGEIKIRSIKDDFKCLKTIKGLEGYIYSLYPLGKDHFVSASKTSSFKIWNVNQPYDCVKTIDENFPINEIIVTKNSQIITATSDKKLNLWTVEI
jgi:WD40 repeat protein